MAMMTLAKNKKVVRIRTHLFTYTHIQTRSHNETAVKHITDLLSALR